MMKLLRVVDPDGVSLRCKRRLKLRSYRTKVLCYYLFIIMYILCFSSAFKAFVLANGCFKVILLWSEGRRSLYLLSSSSV